MNKVLYGIEQCHVAKITETNGEITYGTPFAVPGAVGLNFDPEGEKTPFYADNIKYFIASSNQGYSGDLELAITPEQFLKDILGREQDSNGAIFENADDTTARFALMFQGKGDQTGRRWVFFDCTATRPSRENKTKEESIDVGTETMSITMSPRSTDKAVMAYIEPTTENQTIYNNFFNSVYEKNATPSGSGV